MTKILNPKNIQIITLDPYYHVNRDSKTLEKLKNCPRCYQDISDSKKHKPIWADQLDWLNTDGEPSKWHIEKQLTKIFTQISTKPMWIKIIQEHEYEWSLNSPYDDIIIAYSYDSNFTTQEAAKVFNSNENQAYQEKLDEN